VHGHPVLACETFLDPAHFLGTVYASAGFTYRGDTAGFRRQAPGYTAPAQPKRVVPAAVAAPGLRPPAPSVFDARAVGRRPAGGPQHAAAGRPAGAGGGAGRRPRDAPGPSSASDPAGGRGARRMGGMSGDRAIGPWAQGLTPTPRQRLGCFRSPTTRRWIVPSIDTWRRTLIAVDPDALSTAGATYLARRAQHRAPGAGWEDPAPFGLRHGGPAPGGGAPSARALGGPGRCRREGKRDPGGPAGAGHVAPRRYPRDRGCLAYADPHGPAHWGPGWGVWAERPSQPTASPPAAGAQPARGRFPLGGRGPSRATAGSTPARFRRGRSRPGSGSRTPSRRPGSRG
jgi:hypothetical protein